MADSPASRLVSLDVFRGVTIASMILVNNSGSDVTYIPLEHADWHGWTFTDTVFPFFLWITGVAMTLSFARRMEAGADRGKLLLHSIRRAAIIFGIGLLLAGFPYFQLDRIRIPGVLQRIAVCYLIAAVIFLYTKWRAQIALTVFFLVAYWLLMFYWPVPGFGPGNFTLEGNFEHYVDGLFLTGHMYSRTKTWDPEGIVSTLPAISTALFGVLTGYLLRIRREPAERSTWMFVLGNILILVGLVLSTWMPINKKLWTSSYSVLMAGLAAVSFAICYWLLDGQTWNERWRKLARPFEIYGKNAIAVYVLSGLIAKMLYLIKPGGVPLQKIIFENVFAPLTSEINASLLYAIANVLVCYAAAWYMNRRGWFVKF